MTNFDKEMASIREMYALLKPFDLAAQERICGYVGQLLRAEASREQQVQWAKQQAMNTPLQSVPGVAGIYAPPGGLR